MNIFRQHETFEMEVLELLKNNRLLEPLVFGDGSMLRLCHELQRYSVDLDFWRIKETEPDKIFAMFHRVLENKYEITDAQIKYFTVLFEIRSPLFPKRLKIEIRKKIEDWDFQKKIAYSKFATKQVILKAYTLEQTMHNKIRAILARGEIRDAFDIEFLIRRGIDLPNLTKAELSGLAKKIKKFKTTDLKTTLGSILESELRNYYIVNGFQILEYKLINLMNKI